MTKNRAAFVVGLTGGIGCGKTIIADTFAKKGVALIDTDVISHQLTAPGGAAIEPIRQTFGSQAIDTHGAMDRILMRNRIYTDGAAKSALENILHPLIRAESLQQIQNATQTHSPYIILIVPLLLETLAYREQTDHILVADCSQARQIERVVRRSNMSEEGVIKIIKAQISRPIRLQMADDIITNEGDLASLQPQIEELHQRYLSLAAGKNTPALPSQQA